MSTTSLKDEAHKLVDKMPDNSTWDDLIYEIYGRQVIEKGLSDSKAGRTKNVKDIRKKYGLPKWYSIGQKLQKIILIQFIHTFHQIPQNMPNN